MITYWQCVSSRCPGESYSIKPCNHIVDLFSVTQDNENYYYWLDHHLKEKNTGSWIELSDFTIITNQCTGLCQLQTHNWIIICEIIYWISQFITHTRVYNSLNKHIRYAKGTQYYVESPASQPSVTRLFWSSHLPPTHKCECSARVSGRAVTGYSCTTS